MEHLQLKPYAIRFHPLHNVVQQVSRVEKGSVRLNAAADVASNSWKSALQTRRLTDKDRFGIPHGVGEVL